MSLRHEGPGVGFLDGRFLKLAADNDPLTGTLSTRDILPDGNSLYDLGATATRFAEAWLDQLTVDNLRLDGNTLSSTNTDGNITLNPNGTGVVDLSANIIPDADDSFDLGSTSFRFNDAFLHRIVSTGAAAGPLGSSTVTVTNTASGLAFGYAQGPTVTGGKNLRLTGRGSIAGGNFYSYYTGGAATQRINAYGSGGLCIGAIYADNGTATLTTTASGCFAQGYLTCASTALSTIRSTANGGFAQGFAQATGTAGRGYLTASGQGAFAQGKLVTGAGFTYITSSNSGTFAQGAITSTAAATVLTYITSNNEGSFAQGAITNSGTKSYILSSGLGSFAQGYVFTNISTGASHIKASQNGAFAQGFVRSSFGTSQTAKIEGTFQGTFAHGFARANIGYATIEATAIGAFAAGRAQGGNTTGSSGGARITASAVGAFAFGNAFSATAGTAGIVNASGIGSMAIGYANAATISATATNSFQFDVGTNGTASSLQVGSLFQAYSAGQLRLGARAGATVDGNVWNDSTQLAFQGFVDAVEQTFSTGLYVSTATATVANTVTETTLIGSGIGTVTLPVNFCLAGKSLRIHASGVYSTGNPAATLRIKVKKGTTVLLDTGAQTPSNDMSNRVWVLDTIITARSTTTVIENAFWQHATAATGNLQAWEMNNGTTVVTIGTTSEAIAFTAQWGGASASDTISCTDFTLEVLS